MGDSVPSQPKGRLQRTRSATFSPTVSEFYADDDAPSYLSMSTLSFGAAAFANEANDNIPSTNSFARFDDDTSGSLYIGSRGGQAREPLDDLGEWNPELPPLRTRSQEQMAAILEKEFGKSLPDFVPSLTPRVVDTSGQTPRCRENLSDITDVALELVGTTLVAKSSNDEVRLDMEALHSNLDQHKKNEKFPNIHMDMPGGAANMRNSRQFQLTVRGRTLSGVLFGNGTCKLSQVAIQPSIPNVKPIFTELQRLINEISSAGPLPCIHGASRFEFKEVNISLLKQQFPLPFTVKYSRVEELLALRPLYFTDVSPNRPQTGQGVRFKLTSQLSSMLQIRGTVGAQIYYGGTVQVDGSKNCSVDEHEIVCKWIRQFFMLHRDEIELQSEDVADGSKRKRARPPKDK